jgi:subtilisin family serine protease
MNRRIAVAAFAVLLILANSPAASAAQNGWELPAMSVPAAQATSKGDGVTVAVIDTGIRTSHPVLAGRVTNGPDFLEETDQSESWYGLHGTAMASDVLDVAPAAKVLGLRAIRDNEDPDYQTWQQAMEDPKSGPGGSLVKAIRYAADSGARVISMSLGTDVNLGVYSDDEMRAIQYALTKGVVVVASAGNEGDKDDPVAYPAAYPGVMVVAASNLDGSRAAFSSVHNYVDVAAPGVGINAADATTTGRKPVNGTSPACALTAGVAALILSKYPKLAPRQVVQLLERTASTYNKGHSPLTGYGVINAQTSLQQAASLTPETATLQVGEEGAGSHFGPGDDGTSQKSDTGLASEYVLLAAVSGGVGLLVVVGGVLLLVSGRRVARRWRAV